MTTEFTPDQQAHLERITAAPPAPESTVEGVAIALWLWDVKDESDLDTLKRMWPKVCAEFPDDAAHYRGAAQFALDALKTPVVEP